MTMHYNTEKKTYEYGQTFIELFVESRQATSQWNRTQLHIITETMINAIDTIVEGFMSRGYPGTAVWMLEQLNAINAYVVKHGCLYLEESEVYKAIRQPICEIRHAMCYLRGAPEWLSDINHALSYPIILCKEQLWDFNLQNLQKDFVFNKQKRQEVHAIIETLLTTAITTLKQSSAYREAKQKGHLYFKFFDVIPETPFDYLPTEKRVLRASPSPGKQAQASPKLVPKFRHPFPKPTMKRKKQAKPWVMKGKSHKKKQFTRGWLGASHVTLQGKKRPSSWGFKRKKLAQKKQFLTFFKTKQRLVHRHPKAQHNQASFRASTLSTRCQG